MLDNEEEKMFEKDGIFPMNPQKFDGVEDCAKLSYLSDPSVLYNLKLHYDAKVIYTQSVHFLSNLYGQNY